MNRFDKKIILIILGLCCHAADTHMHKYAKIPPPIINGPHELVEIDPNSVIRYWYQIMNCYAAQCYPCKMIPPFIGKHVTCLSKDKVCDGLEQCPYGDDEDGNCGALAYYCRQGQIRCGDGRCATACDGLDECEYSSDERNCKKDDEQKFPCGKNQLLCADGNCANVCDGKKQCKSGEDEIRCLPQCANHEMICPGSGKCAQYCDGNPECENKEDELFCPEQQKLPCDLVRIANCYLEGMCRVRNQAACMRATFANHVSRTLMPCSGAPRIAENLGVPKDKIDCETRNGLAECICLQDSLPNFLEDLDFEGCFSSVLDMLSDCSFLK